ncbi:MAG: hypothetical protein BECKG1743D_GA0114223_101224 [Candidatus Kentron sp. G]|nr:MAG: hypothetical protein BECKG1743F_GA0114225_102132 [Candidatus Kentron sp. G]VFM98527.1 MAG: hypothetical protein BECKG1743E_GA0114224_101952 [Candidatus Kentron sp. G]VFM99435.1 MAG: hypothetical protein BECKG1743D_GA0114223_101224 [Candidatus Kentron sp. G]
MFSVLLSVVFLFFVHVFILFFSVRLCASLRLILFFRTSHNELITAEKRKIPYLHISHWLRVDAISFMNEIHHV